MKRLPIRLGVWLGAAVLAFELGVPGVPRDAQASDAFNAAKSCRRQLTNQGRNYYKKRLTNLLNCVDKLLKCEILLEVDNTNANSCRNLAEDSCNTRLGAAADSIMSKAQASFDTKATQSCLLLGLSDMLSTSSGGLWFNNDATCNTSADVATLVECIRGRVEVLADSVVALTKPRAALLLGNIGLGDEYPNIPLPGGPPVTVTLMGTAPNTNGNTLVNPGTINVAAGQVLKFVGDASLICNPGPGGNGHVTIEIVDGSVTQSATINEPYGTSEMALFGPYTTNGARAYTINLKEGPCDDTTSGTVSVP